MTRTQWAVVIGLLAFILAIFGVLLMQLQVPTQSPTPPPPAFLLEEGAQARTVLPIAEQEARLKELTGKHESAESYLQKVREKREKRFAEIDKQIAANETIPPESDKTWQIFDRNVIVVLFATPLAVAAYIMAKELGSNYSLISSALIMTTLISAVTISGWLLVLRYL